MWQIKIHWEGVWYVIGYTGQIEITLDYASGVIFLMTKELSFFSYRFISKSKLSPLRNINADCSLIS